MLSERQNKTLRIIVEEYIKTATPVGSKNICDILNCSSATVRNEMALLEDLGFLEKTHTSSGRVPSDKGYHYYVKYLMEPDEISGSDILKLQTIFSNKNLELSDCIKKSIEIVADITEYTAIQLGEASKDTSIKEINCIPLNNNEVIIIIVTDKGFVEHKNIYIDNLNPLDIKKTIKIINDLIKGTKLTEVLEKLEYDVKPIIGTAIKQQNNLYEAIYNAFDEFREKRERHVSGTNNILKIPEFKSRTDKIHEILTKIDNNNFNGGYILNTDSDDITIYIGEETKLDEEIAIIKTNYKTSKEEGSVAIIGPKRMAYDKVLPLLNYIKNQIESGDKYD